MQFGNWFAEKSPKSKYFPETVKDASYILISRNVLLKVLSFPTQISETRLQNKTKPIWAGHYLKDDTQILPAFMK